MERIGEDVGRELRRFGPRSAIAGVVAAWPDAVGTAIARNAWPARLARDGTLYVHTSSSAWAFELSQLEGAVRERLAALVGSEAPRRLRFTPGRLPESVPEPPPQSPPAALEASAEAVREAGELASAVSDAELAERIARAAALSLTKARAGRPF